MSQSSTSSDPHVSRVPLVLELLSLRSFGANKELGETGLPMTVTAGTNSGADNTFVVAPLMPRIAIYTGRYSEQV
jgi:hypothetical protein